MGYRIREIDAESNFCQELRIEMIERVLPTNDIAQGLAAEGVAAQRVRKLDLLLTVLVIVDAGFWPIHTSERIGGRRLLRSVTAGMLVMWDRGFHDYQCTSASSACVKPFASPCQTKTSQSVA